MKIIKTSIEDVFLIKLNTFKDKRGEYFKIFNSPFFKKKKLNYKVKQISITTNNKIGTLRGFHYQLKPFDETKTIICFRGKTFENVIDLRPNSKTYKKIFSTYMDENKKHALYIPKGCAHAFLTLKKNTIVIYYSSNEYNKKFERQIKYNEKEFNFFWPIKPKYLSKKDK